MARLRTSCFTHRQDNFRPFAATAFSASAALTASMLVIPGHAIAQQTCAPQHGGAVIICGNNGGSSSQISSPGSVIIMRQETSAFPGDLPDSALPEEVAAARRGMSFLGSSFQLGDDITGFVTGFGASRDQSGTDVERGYSADRRGIVAGMRMKRPGYALFFGIDLSREDQDYDPDNLGVVAPGGVPILVPPASVDREDIGLSFGGSVDLRPGLVWHAGGRIGRIDLETRRTTYDLLSKDGLLGDPPFPPNIKNTFVGRGSTEGTSIAVQTGLSYGLSLGSGFHGGVSGSLLYVREKFDGFTEYIDDAPPDGPDEGFRFGSDTRRSLVSRIGVEVARPVRLGGAMVVPSLRAAWLHEFSDDSRTIDVHAPDAFNGDVSDGPEDFVIRTNDPDRDYFAIGAAVGTLFAGGRGSLALDYEAIAGHDFIDEHIVSLRFGYRF